MDFRAFRGSATALHLRPTGARRPRRRRSTTASTSRHNPISPSAKRSRPPTMAANGTLLYNTGPLFTPIIAWLLWKKTIRVTGIVSIVLGFLGVALVLDPTRSTLDRLM